MADRRMGDSGRGAAFACSRIVRSLKKAFLEVLQAVELGIVEA